MMSRACGIQGISISVVEEHSRHAYNVYEGKVYDATPEISPKIGEMTEEEYLKQRACDALKKRLGEEYNKALIAGNRNKAEQLQEQIRALTPENVPASEIEIPTTYDANLK